MAPRIFGTDGIRDIANRGFLTPEFVLKLGRVIGYLVHKNPAIFRTHELPDSLRVRKARRSHNGKPQVLIGRDTRLSGQMIENALTAGLTAQGIDINQLGVVSTPGLAYLTRQNDALLGIIISASHNPCESNGIKIFSSEGLKIPDKAERLIERYLLSKAKTFAGPPAQQVGSILDRTVMIQDYVDGLCRARDKYLKGLKIVLDCANGATSAIAPAIFRNLGAHLILAHHQPDGHNINAGCGSLYPNVTRRLVLKHRAHIGLSFDGDGDRLILVDEKGHIRDGDYILAILARLFKAEKQLPKNTVVATVMSNTGLDISLREIGVKLVRTAVGDRNVLAEMLKRGYGLGGEQSGHIIILQRSVIGDGVITALEILKALKTRRQPLSRLAQCLTKYPQSLINYKVAAKPELTSLPGYAEKIKTIQRFLGADSQLVIRYSGTEPLLRVMIEAAEIKKIQSAQQELQDYFRVCKLIT